MKPKLTVLSHLSGGYRRLFAMVGIGLALSACQQQRLEQLEATQQQQTREIAGLKQQLADKEAEVAQLETCVDDLENTVYDDPDSVAYDEERPAGPVAL